MMELDLIYPEHDKHPKMEHNRSHKYESTYISVDIPENKSVMFGSLSGSKIGIWVAHGEGRFAMPKAESEYNVIAKYIYSEYPGNPNGSDYDIAGVVSKDGRHIAIMPHLERSLFPWQCGHHPFEHRKDDFTPWMEAFVNAREWVKKVKSEK